MSDSAVTVTAPVPSILDDARNAVVEVAGKTGEVLATYGRVMNEVFGLEWWTLKGKPAKGVKAERERFVAAFKAKGFEQGTIDVYWSRVKDAAGRVKVQNRVSGASDPEAACLSDLKTLINRIYKMEEADVETDWSDEKAVLIDMFERMGGDPTKI